MKKTICVCAFNYVGFWASFAIELEKAFRVVVFTTARHRALVEKLLENHDIDISIMELSFPEPIPDSNTLDQALQNEKKYGVTYAMLFSTDRGLGDGYITNIKWTPVLKNALHSYEKKMAAMNESIREWEEVMEKYAPVAVVSMMSSFVQAEVQRKYGSLPLGLNYIKFGDRCFWSDNQYFESSKLIERVKNNLMRLKDHDDFKEFEYEYIASSAFSQKSYHANKLKHFLRSCYAQVRKEASLCLHRTIARFRGKAVSPRLAAPFCRMPAIFMYEIVRRFYSRHGLRPEQAPRGKYVYIPMPLEPEIAVMQFSPEMTNVMELIIWVSKSLPADWKVVVKEAPAGFGHRSLDFHRKLTRIPNVELAHPDSHTWDWTRSAGCVAVLTGTAAVEAVYFRKPAITCGIHQIVNLLPTVRHVATYEQTRQALQELVALQEGDRDFEVSRQALYQAMMDTSFSLPGLAQQVGKADLVPEVASAAVRGLLEEYFPDEANV